MDILIPEADPAKILGGTMISFVTNFVIFKLLGHADALTIIIFWLLVVASFICLVIFVMKIRSLNEKLRDARATRIRLQTVVTMEELALAGSDIHRTMPGKLISRTLVVLRKILKSTTMSKPGLLPHEHEHIRITINESLEELVGLESSFVSMLKLAAETGPLVGLFGTVWGLINAFSRISDRQTADIPTVAPGIAEALVITLAGLFVAIPALVYYFIIMQKLKHLEYELGAIADRIEWIIDSSLPRISTAGLGTMYESSVAHQKT